MAYYYTFGRVSPRTHLRLAWILALGATGTVAIIEVIRAISVARYGYRVSEYPFVWDWASVAIFALTSVVGVAVIACLILVMYDSGKGECARGWSA